MQDTLQSNQYMKQHAFSLQKLNAMFGFQERQRKREAPPQPHGEEDLGLSEDAAAAENTAAMAVAAGEVAAATAQAHAASPGSEEHKTAEVRQLSCCCRHSVLSATHTASDVGLMQPLGCPNVGAFCCSYQHALDVHCLHNVAAACKDFNAEGSEC